MSEPFVGSDSPSGSDPPETIRLPWPAWASVAIANALVSDEVEAHVVRGLSGWEPSTAQVLRLEGAFASRDPRHARGAPALALSFAAGAASEFCGASRGVLGLIALVAQPLEEEEQATLCCFSSNEPLMASGSFGSSPVDVEVTRFDGSGYVVLAAEVMLDDFEADPRNALRSHVHDQAVTPEVATLGREVLAGAIRSRRIAKRISRLSRRLPE